jgi:hypothetical protein
MNQTEVQELAYLLRFPSGNTLRFRVNGAFSDAVTVICCPLQC